MGPPTCPHCGQAVVPGAAFCASCGSALAPTAALSSGVPASPAFASPRARYAPAFGVGLPSTDTSSSASRAIDLRALSSVQWAAVVALVGVFLGVITLVTGNYSDFLDVTTNGTTTAPAFTSSALYFLLATAGLGVILTIVELVLFRTAFRTLAPLDARFSTPATLVIVLLVGLALIIVAGAAAVALAFQAISCAGPGNTIPASCINLGTLLDLVGVLLVAALLAVIGYIGLLVGIWRLGTRYNESLFKVGAILLLIPILNFIGVILVLVGARSALGRLSARSTPTSFG